MSPKSVNMSLIRNCVFVSLLLLLVVKPDLVFGSRILIAIPLTTVSEKNTYIPLANALGSRGHNVTVAGRFKSTYESKNVREILALDMPEYMELFSNPLEMRKAGWKIFVNMETDYNVEGCERTFQNLNFQNLRKEKFDLIITNNWFHHCLYGLIYEQNVPFIVMSTMPVLAYTQELTGSRNPTSFVPNPLASTTDDMNFADRVFNTVFDHYFTWYNIKYYIPALEEVYKRHMGAHIPGATDIERNVSLIFSNTHISMTSPRPLPPDIVEVGGMHCRPAKPLPKDLNDYLNGSGEDGFIFFSLGSVIKAKSMPDEWRKIFLSVFSRLKQRVLWKWEADTMEGLPPNVKLGKWLPQQDVLGHPKIKLFISHGGMFSTQEAVYHGVPILGIPIFVDQNMNIEFIEKTGNGKQFEILDLTEEKFEKAVRELLGDASFAKKAKEQASIFRDQPQTPIDRAVYWTEYVIRYNGAHHLRSASRKLNFIQYHSLDVVAFLALILITISYIVFVIGRKLLRLVTSGGASQDQKKRQ